MTPSYVTSRPHGFNILGIENMVALLQTFIKAFFSTKKCIPIQTLTHWGRVTQIFISKLTIIGSDNGLALDRRQAIIWTNAGLLLIGPLRTNFSEILIEILTFSFKKMRLEVSSAKRRPFCLGLNVLMNYAPCLVWWPMTTIVATYFCLSRTKYCRFLSNDVISFTLPLSNTIQVMIDDID